MKFKDPKLEKELLQVPVFLRIMVLEMEGFCLLHFKKELTVTRVFEKVVGATSVHTLGRAVDIRDETIDAKGFRRRTFTNEEAAKIVEHMERTFPRNDGKPSCYHHRFVDPKTKEEGALHFHVQIAERVTTYLPKEQK